MFETRDGPPRSFGHRQSPAQAAFVVACLSVSCAPTKKRVRVSVLLARHVWTVEQPKTKRREESDIENDQLCGVIHNSTTLSLDSKTKKNVCSTSKNWYTS